MEFFVFGKQCIREAVSEMQPLPGSQPKRGRRLKIKLKKLQVVLSSFVMVEPTKVNQIDLLLVRARSGNFASICLSFFSSFHYFLCWASQTHFLELFAWFLINDAQNLELEKLVTAKLRGWNVLGCRSARVSSDFLQVSGSSEEYTGEKHIVLQFVFFLKKKKISPFGVFMCEKQIWDVQVLENKKKKTQRKSACVWGMYNKTKYDVIFLQKSVFVCLVATCLAAPFFPGSLLQHIPFLCWSAPLGWGQLFGPGVGLDQTFLGGPALGPCRAEHGDRNHRSDKRLSGECREGGSFQLKWPGVLRGGQKSCDSTKRKGPAQWRDLEEKKGPVGVTGAGCGHRAQEL